MLHDLRGLKLNRAPGNREKAKRSFGPSWNSLGKGK
jgi:hypothetical protein